VYKYPLAKNKFVLGQYVKMSPLGYQRMRPGHRVAGIVTGFCRSDMGIQVLPMGRATADSYWVGFWSRLCVN
jgi:hypothetical protein